MVENAMSKLESIFLSASIPHREPYVHNSDPIAIREAILALVTQVTHDHELVFGGHPAISPLVDHAARTLGTQKNVYIYQSRWFEDQIPEVAKAFDNLIWTEKKSTRDESLIAMREEMIGSRPFSSAVFIGGMEGILAECEIFKALHPDKPLFPIASTLGATRELFDRHEGPQGEDLRDALVTNKRYRGLFRKILP
jgi:SLOG cluster3 family